MNDKLIKALEETIKTKDELIKHLKEEIERLKAPVINIPWIQPVESPPIYPVQQPYYQPYTNPIPPYTITCGTHGHTFIIKGDGYSGSRQCAICDYAEHWSCPQPTFTTIINSNNSSQAV